MGSHFLIRPSMKMFKYILTISLLVTAILAKPRARKLARSEGSSSWEWPSSWEEFSSGDWPSSWDAGSESPAGSWNMGSGSHHEESSSSWEWPSSWDDFSSGDFSSGDSYGSWESGYGSSSSSWDSMGSWESGSGSPAGR